ncbi:C45 family peptidase [Phytomonospora sp. NPDC050363]|uniref:C45 family peptidase n=1 Tax=Phytomonospora sp. NPDC050363 TaxID=3155642 RepID=UPI0033F141A4
MSHESTVVAGGATDFMTVRHLRLTGGQQEIGRALGGEATGYGWAPTPIDPVLGRARRVWFERHWPQHAERLRGIAEAAGVDPDRDDLAFDSPSSVPAGSGCSAVFCPPSSTVDGHGLFGRNYDFFTMSWEEMVAAFSGPDGTPAAPGGTPIASRPYVLTTVPDDGLATTVITMDNLDGATEGVNEAGLSVALLISDITEAKPPEGPTPPQVGVNPMQLPRFVLETCRTADEAKAALLGAKQSAEVGCHYLIADASGRAFVWERAGGVEHIIEAEGGGPLCVTNHLLSRHPVARDLPADTEETFLTYGRARTLTERVEGAEVGRDFLEDAMDEVSVPAAPDFPWRTLWRSVIDVNEPSLETRFYLGDADGAVRRSEALRFTPK